MPTFAIKVADERAPKPAFASVYSQLARRKQQLQSEAVCLLFEEHTRPLTPILLSYVVQQAAAVAYASWTNIPGILHERKI